MVFVEKHQSIRHDNCQLGLASKPDFALRIFSEFDQGLWGFKAISHIEFENLLLLNEREVRINIVAERIEIDVPSSEKTCRIIAKCQFDLRIDHQAADMVVFAIVIKFE